VHFSRPSASPTLTISTFFLMVLLASTSVITAQAAQSGAPSADPSARSGGAAAPSGASYSLWGSREGKVASGDARTFGTRFRVSRSGDARAIRFMKPSGDTGKHVGRLYTARGKLLAQVRFAGESASGWQTARLNKRVPLRKGRSYVVTYTSKTGLHSVGGRLPARTGSIRAVAGVVGPKGAVPSKASSVAQLVDIVYHPRVGPFPNASNTGAPAGGLSAYSGPCTITRDGTVIDHKVVNCSLDIRAAKVRISHSVINGTINSGDDQGSRFSFKLVRSTLDVSPNGVAMETGVGDVNFKVIRSEIRGGNRGINCWYRCVVRASWIHGQDTDSSGVTHMSGIRMGQRARLIGNSIGCDAPEVPPEAGCSAPLTGYGDFGPVRDNIIDGNLFLATTGAVCAYGGSSGGKPYSDDAANIKFYNNVFQRGDNGNCGAYGPVMDFDRRAPGNVFVGNTWADGGRVRP
jgi:Domain of unknown function (DUF4082)